MKPNRIILMRHGESAGNVDSGVYLNTPDYKMPLTKVGVQQARGASKTLEAIIPLEESLKVYCSPYYRARDTLREVTKNRIVNVEYDPRIREREWTGWYGDHAAVPKDRAYKFFYRMSQGESCADVYTRMTSFIESMEKDFEASNFEDNVLIVSHGTAIRIFLMRWFRWDVDTFYTIATPKNCGIVTLVKKDTGRYELEQNITRCHKGDTL